jgi:hypothetical protein
MLYRTSSTRQNDPIGVDPASGREARCQNMALRPVLQGEIRPVSVRERIPERSRSLLSPLQLD